MLNFLNKPKKEFSVGHFDLIFVDEAHRSLFNVYRAIFEYFDSFIIGLTATPSKAIDRSTYEILDLNTDEPTFEVKFEEAVNLNYLVSYRAFDKTSAVMKNGLKYNDLSEAEKEQYEEMFADENGNIPEEVAGKAFYRDIFNNDIETRKDNNPALFVSLLYPYNRLKVSGVEIALRKIGEHLEIGNVHPHKFRRTLATKAIDKGMPIEQVQHLLGHAKIDTTLEYAMVDDENVKISHKKYLG